VRVLLHHTKGQLRSDLFFLPSKDKLTVSQSAKKPLYMFIRCEQYDAGDLNLFG
jgi:hypothetical protein